MTLPSRTYNGVLAITAANWDLFVSGVAQGGQWLEFQEAVSRAWVPNTPSGYETFISWWAAASSERLAAGLYEFQGWVFARNRFSPELVQQSLSAYISNGQATQAQAQEVLDAYNRYAGAAVPVTSIGTWTPSAPTPDLSYPVGIQLLLAGPPVTQPNGSAAAIVIGYRTVTVYTASLGPGLGNTKLGAWSPTPGNWLTMLGVEWRGGAQPLEGIYGSRWVGLDPDSASFVTVAQQQLSGDPYNAFTLPARASVDTPAFEAWLRSALPTWNGSQSTTLVPVAPGPTPTGTVTPVTPPPTVSGPIRPSSSLPTGGAGATVPTASTPGGGGTVAIPPTLQVGAPGAAQTPVAVQGTTAGDASAAPSSKALWWLIGAVVVLLVLGARKGG